MAHRHSCIPIFDYVIRWTHPRQYKVFRSNMRIRGVRRESREYNWNPRSTIEILGVRWTSREYDGHPGSTIRILRVRWESREYNGIPWSTRKIPKIPAVHNPPFPPCSPYTHKTLCANLRILFDKAHIYADSFLFNNRKKRFVLI